eukprot:GFKZ01003843.1.p1 GENE.GFKZ01003843.1~~GFKZ01003843.1.p1  ORF type:complete len:205 (-),score=29.87 GFKZ01003843.1:697-1311(-)
MTTMPQSVAFSSPSALPARSSLIGRCTSLTPYRHLTPSQKIASKRRSKLQPRADAAGPESTERTPEEIDREEQDRKLARMRLRLEGLFGTATEEVETSMDAEFDGQALRNTILERWGVQYDVQPQKRHGRVYVQIMWRYFEQQSFYMQEDEFASHCEAVALLLNEWNAVDYFCDYVTSIKKRPVVGITINIPIPNVPADSVNFE